MSFDKVNISLVPGLGLMLVTTPTKKEESKEWVRLTRAGGCGIGVASEVKNRKRLFSDGKDVAILL